ncbi:tRNA 2-selenouridine(34) synthase MnmH [Phaeovulum sp.]|uniref:tRNA 2-selenouridine(34) synthase MnmH n=1 Tax=Phaeovulum sp. TaxID=2934796 RepID=UPI0039E717CC
MALELTSVGQLAVLGFDTIIDVRSPSEYAEDHVPGAINLPVLADDERARVGTMYKQVSSFDARRLGAALVARNAAHHLEEALADKGGAWRPLVYCWRGGQRSGAFTTVLQQVGWRAERIDGGYKSWRRLVVDQVNGPVAAPVVMLDGNTGSAKTDLLIEAARAGAQVIDLEGLANHRGSLFGAMPGGQPSQKAFEGRLARVLAALDPTRPVLIEAESSRIGEVVVPRGLWAAMCAAPRLRLAVPLSARAAYLARAYRDVVEDAPRLADTISRLRRLHGAEVIDRWQQMAALGEVEALAADLMQAHYDPRYEKSRARRAGDEIVLETESLAIEALPAMATKIWTAAQSLVQGRG